MEICKNEHDQVDAVKHFLVENGKALAVGVTSEVGALAGRRCWTSYQTESACSVSLAYQNMATAVSVGKPDSTPAAEELAAEGKNTYDALVSLELAQQFADQSKLEKAASQLQQGLAAASDENPRAVTNLCLARVQVQLKQVDTVLRTLDTIKGEGWTATVVGLRDEALLSKGDEQGTRSARGTGAKSDASPTLSEMMRMKISNSSV